MTKNYIFMMLGLPGSGKSSFARNLADSISSVHLNSDAMRMAIFKSREEIDEIYHSDHRGILNTYTFGALNYAASSALHNGCSVIYDANNNTKRERLDTVTATKSSDTLAVVVWIQTPFEDAVIRAVRRRESDIQRQLSDDTAREYITKIAAEIEEPGNDENFIIIDGMKPFEQQYHSFQKQLAEVEDE